MTLPPWLVERTPVLAASLPAPRRNAARRAMGSLAGLLESLLANTAIAEGPGLLQELDARAKVLGLVGLIVVVTLVSSLPALAGAYAFCLLLAVASRVPLRRLAQSWLAVPLFSAAIVLPALLNIVTPGRALLPIWHNLVITDAGVIVASRFVLRTAVCVSLALLLSVTTPTHRLFRGLRALGIPRLFIVLLTMMERYLTVFIRAAEEIHLAKISRSVAVGTLRQEQAWVAAGMGALFRRTQALGQAVYLAMLSRGYTGEVHLLDDARWGAAEWVFLLAMAACSAALLIWP
jgi:cobalt/nickel transport system permease protein